MTSTDEPYDVNVRQAAEILGVHENTVRAWAKGGHWQPQDPWPGDIFSAGAISCWWLTVSSAERLIVLQVPVVTG